MTLSVRRRGAKGTFRGRVAPAHPRARVTVQVKAGRRWKRLRTVRLSRTSSFSFRAALRPKAKYRFRTVMAADAEHLAGRSAEALVDAMKVTLKASVRGRAATFTGAIAPRHRRVPVIVEVQRQGRWVALARTRASARSTFRVRATLPAGLSVVRARTRDDRDHFGGVSPQRTLTVR
jgi:hypothetical protein